MRPRSYRSRQSIDPPNNPRDVAERLRSLAQAEKVEWQSVALRYDPNGVAQAFAEFGRGRNGLLVDNSTPVRRKADQICSLALQRRIPAVGRERAFVDAGCLMCYGENVNEMYRRAAGLVDRILKGAKPADLPVEMPTKFDLIINLKTAKALGLTIPPSLLQRADEVIQ